MDEIMNEELVLDSISDALSTFIEQGTENVINVFTSNEAAVIWETVTDVSADLVKASKVIMVIRKAASIPDMLFMNKMEKYCRGLIEIEAKMDGLIDDETYRRLMLLVDRTMYSELLYLKSNITDDSIVIENNAEQRLLANGWLYYFEQTWGTSTEDSQSVYNYTDIAKQFCQLIEL